MLNKIRSTLSAFLELAILSTKYTWKICGRRVWMCKWKPGGGVFIGNLNDVFESLWNQTSYIQGQFTPCQVEHHVRTKFATPMLHVIYNFKNYDIFSTYTTPLIIYILYIYFVIFIFVVIILVQFYVILLRKMLYLEKPQLWLSFSTM